MFIYLKPVGTLTSLLWNCLYNSLGISMALQEYIPQLVYKDILIMIISTKSHLQCTL